MLLSFGKWWICSHIQMLQLTSISRLSEQVLRGIKRVQLQGFQREIFIQAAENWRPGSLSPGCLLYPSLLHRLWVQARTSLWLPGLTILVRLCITKCGFFIKWWSHCRKRERNAGLQQFKIDLKWTTYGHHTDFEWLLCGDHIEPTSSQKYQKKCCTSQEMLHYGVQVLGSQPQLVQGGTRL